jgi:Phytanoyl-CoA dioxygenase (PhyH)
VRLTEERLRWYHEDGFLPIDRVIGDDALAELRVAYDDVVDWRAEAPADQMLGGRVRVVTWPSATHAFFADNPARTGLQEIADQVLGDAISTFDLLIGKPPGDPEITPWHQDMAYSTQPFAPAGTDVPPWNLRFWVALDDTDLENGCMHFLPGYHRQPLLEHSVTAGDPDSANRLLALVDLDHQVDLERAVAVRLRAGDATMHGYGTPHYAGPNRSTDRPRRAYIVNFTRRSAG